MVSCRRLILVTHSVLLLGLAPPRCASAQADASRLGIADFAAAFTSAVRAWDVDRWAGLVTEDIVMMAPNGRVLEGRQAFRELWSRTFEGQTGSNPLHVVVKDSVVVDDLAVVRADYGPEGQDPVGRYVWKLVRDREGAWMLDWWIFTRQP